MGAGYSQPPRGYQYSTIENKDVVTCRTDPNFIESESFESFAELFQKNWEIEKKFPYIAEIGHNGAIVYHTYEECFRKIQNIKPELLRFSRSKPLGIYASNTFQAILIHDAAALSEVPVLASGPGLQTEEEFIESAKKANVGAIYCDKSLQQDIQALCNIPFFSDINHIPDFDTTRNEDEEDYDICSALNTDIKYKISETLTDLGQWGRRMKICRDAKVALAFPMGHNLNRLVRYVCIEKRALICIGADFNNCSVFNATHYFGTSESFNKHISEKVEAKKAKGVLYNLKYIPYNMLKTVKMALGGTSTSADKKVFNALKTDFGTEMRYMFTDNVIDPNAHDLFTTIYTLPLSVIYVPEEWVNYGTCIPPDPRFTKYGTTGGPVACSITIEDGKLECSKSDKIIESKAWWDEEGSLVVEN